MRRIEKRGAHRVIDEAKKNQVYGRLEKKSEVEGECVAFFISFFMIFVAEVCLNLNCYFDAHSERNR